eukprot:GFYU01009829.1.p1 GENE.GFYU01009829.1~~GFYU01009829.1.p1  ORF type:complete len:472 (+),score=112.38 GFYU01009829.1:318-1733(+)
MSSNVVGTPRGLIMRRPPLPNKVKKILDSINTSDDIVSTISELLRRKRQEPEEKGANSSVVIVCTREEGELKDPYPDSEYDKVDCWAMKLNFLKAYDRKDRIVTYDPDSHDVMKDEAEPNRTEWAIATKLTKLVTGRVSPHIYIFYGGLLRQVEEPSSLKSYVPFDSNEDSPFLSLMMFEHMHGGTVLRFLRSFSSSQRNELAGHVKYIMFQVIYTLAAIQKRFKKFRHNDLHLGNLMIQYDRGGGVVYDTYDAGFANFHVPSKGYQVMFVDWGQSTMATVPSNHLVNCLNCYGIADDADPFFDMHTFLNDMLRELYRFDQDNVPPRDRTAPDDHPEADLPSVIREDEELCSLYQDYMPKPLRYTHTIVDPENSKLEMDTESIEEYPVTIENRNVYTVNWRLLCPDFDYWRPAGPQQCIVKEPSKLRGGCFKPTPDKMLRHKVFSQFRQKVSEDSPLKMRDTYNINNTLPV